MNMDSGLDSNNKGIDYFGSTDSDFSEAINAGMAAAFGGTCV
jgi:hypothetical protein